VGAPEDEDQDRIRRAGQYHSSVLSFLRMLPLATQAAGGSLMRMVRPEKIPVRRRRFRGTYLV
jgi:hypothetical protein